MGQYGHSEERPKIEPLFAMTTQVPIRAAGQSPELFCTE